MSQEKIDSVKLHDEHNIRGFFEEYRFLSNFHKCDIEFEGLIYPSTENAYQAAKTLDLEKRKEFTTIEPNVSKNLGRTVVLRPDWEDIKVQLMLDLTEQKFKRHADLGEKLLETGSKYLEETNWWNDTYWGVCNGKGENKLGLILMAVRAIIGAEISIKLLKEVTVEN